MADKKLEFEVAAKDKYSETLDDAADQADELAHTKVEVPVTADSDVGAVLDDVRDDLDRLAHDPTKLPIEVDQTALKKAKGDMGSVGDGAGEMGSRFGAQFAADFGGVINEEVSGMGNQLTQGLEAAMQGFGVSANIAGPLIAALGIGTVVAAAAKTLWDTMNAGAEAYKKQLAAASEVQQSLVTGDMNAAIRKLDEQLGPMARTLEVFGVSVQQAGEYVLGASSSLGIFSEEMSDTETWERVTAKADELGESNGTLKRSFDDARNAVNGMRAANRDAGVDLFSTQRRMFELLKATEAATGATEGTTGAMFDLAAQTKGATHDAIIEHIGLINGIPKGVITNILTDTNPDDVAQTKAVIDNLTKARTVPVTFAVDVNAADIANQVRTAVALAGGTVQQSVSQYQARNGPLP